MNKIMFHVLIFIIFVFSQRVGSQSLKVASKQANPNIINRNDAKENIQQKDDLNIADKKNQNHVLKTDLEKTDENENKSLDTDSKANNDGEYLSLENQLHGETHHVLSGKHRSFGTVDQESLLHDGDHDVHNRKQAKEQEDEGEVNMEQEIEQMLHDDDGHAHDKPDPVEVDDGKAFDTNDPEHTLHDEDVHDPNRVSDEEEDDVEARRSFNPESVGGKIDSMTREDFLDYQEWRENRHVGKKNWMSGFNYLGDSIKINLDAIKTRYLSKFFDGDESKPNNIHDEA